MMKVFLSLMCVLFFAACNYNNVKGDAPAAAGGPPGAKSMAVVSLDYQSLNRAVIGPQCLQCHSNAGGNKGGLGLETYAQVRASLGRIYYRSIEKKDMPSGGLGEAQLQILKAWIDAGGPERSTGKGAARPITGPISWTVIKNQVLASSCLDCHSGASADAGLDFQSLEVVKKNINLIFDTAIVKQTMPLEPYAALTDAEKQALMKWISQGMPE